MLKKEEFAQIAMAIRTYYPRENILPNDNALDLWFDALCDIEGPVLGAALKKWVTTQKFAPTIADLREQSEIITNGDLPDWGAAWEKVQDAVHYHGFYAYNNAMNSLDDITRTCVNRIGWDNLCLSTNHEASRANFRSIYEQEVRRRREVRRIPQALQNMIADMFAQKAQERIARKGGGDA